MVRNILRGICRKRGGRVAIAGAIGVLTGFEQLMRRKPVSSGINSAEQWFATADAPSRVASRQDYFEIRRSRLERGYTYWVLQGFGKHRCFVVCDTWQEAMDEASAKLKSAYRFEGQLEIVNAGVRG